MSTARITTGSLLASFPQIDTDSNVLLGNQDPSRLSPTTDLPDYDSDDEVDISTGAEALPPSSLSRIAAGQHSTVLDAKGKDKQRESPILPSAGASRSPQHISLPLAALIALEIRAPQPLYAQGSSSSRVTLDAAGPSHLNRIADFSPVGNSSTAESCAPAAQSAQPSMCSSTSSRPLQPRISLSSRTPPAANTSHYPHAPWASVVENQAEFQTPIDKQRAQAPNEARPQPQGRPRRSHPSQRAASNSGSTSPEHEWPGNIRQTVQSPGLSLAELEANDWESRADLQRRMPPTPEYQVPESFIGFFDNTDSSPYLNPVSYRAHSKIADDFLDSYDTQSTQPASETDARTMAHTAQIQPHVIDLTIEHSPHPFTQSLDLDAEMTKSSSVRSPQPSAVLRPLPIWADILLNTASEHMQSSWAPRPSAFWSANYDQTARPFVGSVPKSIDFDTPMMEDSFEMMVEPVVAEPWVSISKVFEDVEMVDSICEPQPWATNSMASLSSVITAEAAAPNGKDSSLEDSPMTDTPPSILDYHLATTADVDMEDSPAVIVPSKSSFSYMLSSSIHNRHGASMPPPPIIASLPRAVHESTLPPAPSAIPVGNFNASSRASIPPSAPPAVIAPTILTRTSAAQTNMNVKVPPVLIPEVKTPPQPPASTSQSTHHQPATPTTPVPSSPISLIFRALLDTSPDIYHPTSAPFDVRPSFNATYSARLHPQPRRIDSILYAQPRETVNPPPAPQRTVTFYELVDVWRKLASAPIGQLGTYDELKKKRKDNYLRCTTLRLGAKQSRTWHPPKPPVPKSWFPFPKLLAFFRW